MNSNKFRGTTVALVTPFLPGGDVDVVRLKALIDWHVEEGTDVILATGTTGEASTLATTEHRRVMELIIDHCAGRRRESRRCHRCCRSPRHWKQHGCGFRRR